MFLKAENGTALGEYGLIAGLVALLAIPALIYLGTTDNQLFGSIGSATSSDNQLLSLISAKKHPAMTSVATSNPAGSTQTTQTSASAITLDPKTGQLMLNLPGAGGSGANSSSVEGQFTQTSGATQLLANQMLSLANQLASGPGADSQLSALIKQMANNGLTIASHQNEYATVGMYNDGVCYNCIYNLIQMGQVYQQAEARITSLSANGTYNYAPLNNELTQLSAVISKLMAQNYMNAPVTPSVNCINCPSVPAGTKLVDLLSNPNTYDIQAGNIVNPQQTIHQLDNTVAMFNNVPIDVSAINQILTPPATNASSGGITAAGTQYTYGQQVSTGTAQKIVQQYAAPYYPGGKVVHSYIENGL